VANEERVMDLITLTAEPGIVGGVPAGGLDFGAGFNVEAVVEQNQQFDFYDGGGLDLAVLGMAECDAQGNVNVSRFGPRLAGAGGFINISQNAKTVVFAGTFSAGGLVVEVGDGRLAVRREGRAAKFGERVEQVTFAGAQAAARGQRVLYVTERCVFELTAHRLRLTEVAPGIDVERDILAQMAFRPIVEAPRAMDARLFSAAPIDLRNLLLDPDLPRRIHYDAAHNTLMLDLHHLRVTGAADIAAIREAVVARCEAIGRPVHAVVNYDGFQVAPGLEDDYAAMAHEMHQRFYASVTRYASGAFRRMKVMRSLGHDRSR
jgi:propionate CoA-transferase